jgi:hypothetical protein
MARWGASISRQNHLLWEWDGSLANSPLDFAVAGLPTIFGAPTSVDINIQMAPRAPANLREQAQPFYCLMAGEG